MTSEKFIAFTKKLLDKTKSKEIVWKRLPIHFNMGAEDKCFRCSAKNMDVSLITSAKDPELHYLRVSYDSKVPNVELRPRNQDEEVVLLRLFNYVYNLFPNLESSVDEFLNDF